MHLGHRQLVKCDWKASWKVNLVVQRNFEGQVYHCKQSGEINYRIYKEKKGGESGNIIKYYRKFKGDDTEKNLAKFKGV